MEVIDPRIARGREEYERRSWEGARDALIAAREAGPLAPDDLWRLALASYLIGREDEFVGALREAHQAHLDAGQPAGAVRCAFWVGLHLAEKGEIAQASGWFGRAARLLEPERRDSPERGYLLLPAGHRSFIAGDNEAAGRAAAEAAAIGQRFGDADLVALALHLHGRALLRQGRVPEGLALLDEAMIGVTADELSPQVTGLVYCSVIGACREVWALRRAQEWTAALTEWCARQPDMVAYTGECRAYRAETLRLRGDWAGAVEEARRALERFAGGSQPNAAGFALYLESEVYRLKGELAAAEEGYRTASRHGYEPQPGLALLRLAQGEVEAAAAACRRTLSEAVHPLRRARLLPAHVEIMLEAGELDEARRASAELTQIAESCGRGALEAVAAQAQGAVELAGGDPSAALAPLRRAWQEWQALDARYDAARARVLLGLACRELGDDDGATLELEAARAEFLRLGAGPDVARLDSLTRREGRRDRHGLTPRELEVLALVATGRTNRAIASSLFISEKTVARHVANIFAKLGLSSRAAATAYAYQHRLVQPHT